MRWFTSVFCLSVQSIYLSFKLYYVLLDEKPIIVVFVQLLVQPVRYMTNQYVSKYVSE